MIVIDFLSFLSNTERAFSLGISTSQHDRCRLPLTLTRPPSTKTKPRTLEANCHVENWTQTIYWYRIRKPIGITFITITFQNTVMKWSSALYTQSTRKAQAPEATFAPGARHFHVQRLFSTAISSSPTSRWTAWTCAAPTELPPSRSRRPGPCKILKRGGRRFLRGGRRRARDQKTFDGV